MNTYRKGANAERELAAILSAMFGIEVKRGASPFVFGFIGRDVIGLPGIHCEVKRRERLSLPAALRQAAQDAGTLLPIVAHRINGDEWLLTVRLADLPELAEKLSALLRK